MTFPDLSQVLIGPDLSNYNAIPDPTILKQQRISFGIVKLGQGLLTSADNPAAFTSSGLDVKAMAHENALLVAGCKATARYFFPEAGPSGKAQAERMWTLTNQMGNPKQHGHALDVEAQNRSGLGPDYQTIVDLIVRWYQLTDCPLGLYSAQWYWGGGTQLGHLHNPAIPQGIKWLWDGGTVVAQPNSTQDPWQVLQTGGIDHQGVTPGYWRQWGDRPRYDLRQYYTECSIGGVFPCDVSVFPGTIDELITLWGIAPEQRYKMLAFATGFDIGVLVEGFQMRKGVMTTDVDEAKAAILRGDKVLVIGGPAAHMLGVDPMSVVGKVQDVALSDLQNKTATFAVGADAKASMQLAWSVFES